MYACGDVHAANVPLPAGVSRRHSNVEPGAVEVNVNDADVLLVSPDGPPVIVVSGAAVETVKLRVAARRVRVAGGVAGADVERVRAVGERADRAR